MLDSVSVKVVVLSSAQQAPITVAFMNSGLEDPFISQPSLAQHCGLVSWFVFKREISCLAHELPFSCLVRDS